MFLTKGLWGCGVRCDVGDVGRVKVIGLCRGGGSW